jgi:hypothetical protein
MLVYQRVNPYEARINSFVHRSPPVLPHPAAVALAVPMTFGANIREHLMDLSDPGGPKKLISRFRIQYLDVPSIGGFYLKYF